MTSKPLIFSFCETTAKMEENWVIWKGELCGKRPVIMRCVYC